MEQERYYFRVGVAVSAAFALFLAVVAWFTATHNGQQNITYAIYFEGSVSGLSLGSPVTLQGISVGQVKAIEFESKETNRIRVLVDIIDSAPIREGTIASLRLQGITGNSVLALENQGRGGRFLMIADGEPYIVIPSQQSSLEKVFTSVPELLEELNELAQRGQKLLSDENMAKFGTLLDSIDQSAKSVQQLLGGKEAKSVESAMLELNQFLVEGKITMREIRMLARTVREDPSVVIRGVKDSGKSLP